MWFKSYEHFLTKQDTGLMLSNDTSIKKTGMQYFVWTNGDGSVAAVYIRKHIRVFTDPFLL